MKTKWRDKVHAVRNEEKRGWNRALHAGAAILLAVVTGCSTIDPVTGQQTRNFYSIQDDVDIGTQVYRETVDEMRARGVKVNADAARTAQLQEWCAASNRFPLCRICRMKWC